MRKAFESSWAKIFAEEIFPSIDEERFSVLYSDRTQCRANTPVNSSVGALIIKELFQISDDADKRLTICGSDFDDTTEYQLVLRCLSEQTVLENSTRRLRNKEDGGFSSSMLQSPTDPDATFREKAGKQHRGYVANLEENEDGTRIIKCPAGYSPVSGCCSSSNGHIHASFSKKTCMNCPNKDNCRIREYKKVCSIDILATAQYRANTRRYMKAEEFKALARLRNGVETLPSILRSRYQVARMAV